MDVDDTGVSVAGVGRVTWADLAAVTVRTTGVGPFADDLHWELHGRDGRVLSIGSATEGLDALLPRLQVLPGFDNEAVIRAATSTEDAVFPCWPRRTVTLREERHGADVRWLGAYVDGAGALHIDGHDLGPGTAPVSDDGEYEWFTTVAAGDVGRVVEVLGGGPGDDVLELLARDWSGPRSYELERLLRESGIPMEHSVWSG